MIVALTASLLFALPSPATGPVIAELRRSATGGRSARPGKSRVRGGAVGIGALDGGGGRYRSCAEARAAGAAPLRQGQTGYSTKLDRDRDGVACE